MNITPRIDLGGSMSNQLVPTSTNFQSDQDDWVNLSLIDLEDRMSTQLFPTRTNSQPEEDERWVIFTADNALESHHAIDNPPSSEEISRNAAQFFPNPQSCLETGLLAGSLIKEKELETKTREEFKQLRLSPDCLYPNNLLKRIETISSQVGKSEIPNFTEADGAKSIEQLWTELGTRTGQLQMTFLDKQQVAHRFSDIRCPSHSAVQVDGCYLHANIIKNHDFSMIASQSPLPTERDLFWKALFEKEYAILDLTNEKDRQSGGVIPYYPQKLNDTIEHVDFKINCIQENNNCIQYCVVNKKTNQSRSITRFVFKDWPDFGVIEIAKLEELVDILNPLARGSNASKGAWVHCRAGVGRTGTVITAFLLKEKISNREINLANYEDSLLQLILDLRKERGPAFVQSREQFTLLYSYGKQCLNAIQSA